LIISRRKKRHNPKPQTLNPKSFDHLAQGKTAQVDDIDDDAPLIAVVAPPTLSRDDKAIKLHSEKLQAIRTALKGVYTGTIKIVLEHNGLRSNGGDITLQHRLADVMLHGVPEPCPKVYTPLSPSLSLSLPLFLSPCPLLSFYAHARKRSPL
jgi:hypothetical protein